MMCLGCFYGVGRVRANASTEYKVARECEAANVIGQPRPACKEQLLARGFYRAMSVVYLNSPIAGVCRRSQMRKALSAPRPATSSKPNFGSMISISEVHKSAMTYSKFPSGKHDQG